MTAPPPVKPSVHAKVCAGCGRWCVPMADYDDVAVCIRCDHDAVTVLECARSPERPASWWLP